jgi:predicted RNase H-like nuclease (RuvC/YqgF family)
VYPENSDSQSPKELVEGLYRAFDSFRRKMEDPSYIQLEASIKQLIDNQNEMKAEVRELKKQLLNPNDGIVVAVNKNTSFRHKAEENEDEYLDLIREHKELMKFKSGITKIMWGLASGIGSLIIYYLTKLKG